MKKPVPVNFFELRGTPANPFPKEEVERGVFNLPRLKELRPTKMSFLEHEHGYLIEDSDGDVYCFSVASVSRLGWHEYDFPEVSAELIIKWNNRKRD